MHAAHLEHQIDDLLYSLSGRIEYSDKVQRKPISTKIKIAKKALSEIDHDLAREIINDLDTCLENFEWRNELVHGRIYSPKYHEKNLKSGRPNIPDRKADSAELYTLANNLNELRSRIYGPMLIRLPELLSELDKEDA